jgi:hypothetical protein
MGAYIKYIIAFGIIGGAGYMFYKLYSDSKTTGSTGTSGGTSGGTGTPPPPPPPPSPKIDMVSLQGKSAQFYLDKITPTDVSLENKNKTETNNRGITLKYYYFNAYPDFFSNEDYNKLINETSQDRKLISLIQKTINYQTIYFLYLLGTSMYNTNENLKNDENSKKLVDLYVKNGFIPEDGRYNSNFKRYLKFFNDGSLEINYINTLKKINNKIGWIYPLFNIPTLSRTTNVNDYPASIFITAV